MKVGVTLAPTNVVAVASERQAVYRAYHAEPVYCVIPRRSTALPYMMVPCPQGRRLHAEYDNIPPYIRRHHLRRWKSPVHVFDIFLRPCPYRSVSFPFARSPFDAPPCICLILNIARWMLVKCLARTARQKDWIVVAASFCSFSSWEMVGPKCGSKGAL